MRTGYEHCGTILSGSLRSRNQAAKLACFLEVKFARMSNAVHVVVSMEPLTRCTISNIERDADAQQRIDAVLLDKVLADDAEALLKDRCSQLVQHRRLADFGDGW